MASIYYVVLIEKLDEVPERKYAINSWHQKSVSAAGRVLSVVVKYIVAPEGKRLDQCDSNIIVSRSSVRRSIAPP